MLHTTEMILHCTPSDAPEGVCTLPTSYILCYLQLLAADMMRVPFVLSRRVQ